MPARNATNGFLRLFTTDTFTSPAGPFQPRFVSWAGGSAISSRAYIVDADGVTVCYLTIGGPGQMASLGKEFYGEARPWKTPITATMSGGMILIGV
jgi:hypothetical protein